MIRGRFISLEGGEGSGKTTQVKRLVESLKSSGKAVVATREPGGTPSAEAVRELLVKGSEDKWHPVAETLLFYAARVEHVERHVKPMLAQGITVISDRFHDSTLVYQGVAKQQGISFIQQLHALVLGNFAPDLTLYLDIDPAEGLARAGKRADDETRFEKSGISFHTQVRLGFHRLAEMEPQRIQLIDASGTPDEVHGRIIHTVRSASEVSS